VQKELATREYQASENGAGLQAPNRAQDLRTYFDARGIRVHDRTAPGSPELLALTLSRVGRGKALARIPAGEISHEGARVEIRHPRVLEWYDNSDAGLEQASPWRSARRAAARSCSSSSSRTQNELHHWRARVQYAEATGPLPAHPAHGPWRREQAQSVEADIRTIPEPGVIASLASGVALLAALARNRRATR